MDLQNKVCIITGSTSGIGKVTATALAASGVTLVLPVRNMVKGENVKQEIIAQTKNDRIELFPCDLSVLKSVHDFTLAFKQKYNRLHILINNAGIWAKHFGTTSDGIERTFAINHLAPFLLTNLLLDVMKQSAPARIINLSSIAHKMGTIDFDDLEGRKKFSLMKSYGQSKLANILFTKKLAKDLKEFNITANCVHPGGVRTELFQEMSWLLRMMTQLVLISPEKGAETSIYLATSDEVQNITGEYFAKKKIRKPIDEACNMDIAEQLWKVSEDYLKDYLEK